jgi:cytochrome c oxidase assembly protein subunit 15
LGFAVVALLALQYGLGLADVLLLAPVWMQIFHLLGADLLWIALVVLTARVCVGAASKTMPPSAQPS